MKTNKTATGFLTMKTFDVDLQDNSSLEFLQKTYGDIAN
jgi:hypothetical protein